LVLLKPVLINETGFLIKIGSAAVRRNNPSAANKTTAKLLILEEPKRTCKVVRISAGI
jgi:hypothetical protein